METEIETKLKQNKSDNPESKIQDSVLINDSILNSSRVADDKLEKESELSGVLCEGIQYYDFKNIPFISNTGLASLIRILKSSLKQGIKLKFVNVNKRIKQKIKTMGLDRFINCS